MLIALSSFNCATFQLCCCTRHNVSLHSVSVGLVDSADVILCCCTRHNVSVHSVTVGLVDSADVTLCCCGQGCLKFVYRRRD